VAAVESGRLAEERLTEAAGRVARLSEWASRAAPPPGIDRSAGLEGARRALLVEGNVVLAQPAVVIELLPDPNIAAGPAAHSLAELLGVEAVTAGEAVVRASGRRLVIVLRDAHRYEWARDETERLVAAAPDAIVVETGVPSWRPSAVGYIATHGAGRANLEAAAARLRGG
jgi:beta-N-acetylhexosaminidase